MFGSKNNKEKPDREYFTIYDTKGAIYWDPMAAINREDMIRQLFSLFTDPSQQRAALRLNPEDYQLFKIGDYYKQTGMFVGHQPEHVANIHDIASASKQRSDVQQIPSGH